MSVAVNTMPKSNATVAIGSCSGSDTYQNFLSPVAPSIFAASSTSVGIDEIPAMKMTVANGRMRHVCTKMIDAFAVAVVPSHCGGVNVSIGAIWMKSGQKSRAKHQLITL